MGISLILGGSEPLPGWFGALMQRKLKLKWAFACVLRLARMLCALMYRQNGDLANLLKSAQKKVPQSVQMSAGRGVQSLFGQCPNRGDIIFNGASLSSLSCLGFSCRSVWACGNVFLWSKKNLKRNANSCDLGFDWTSLHVSNGLRPCRHTVLFTQVKN